MQCDMKVQCVSKDICTNCPYLELEIRQMRMSSGDKMWNINEIFCKKYEQCSKMLAFLNKNTPEDILRDRHGIDWKSKEAIANGNE